MRAGITEGLALRDRIEQASSLKRVQSYRKKKEVNLIIIYFMEDHFEISAYKVCQPKIIDTRGVKNTIEL